MIENWDQDFFIQVRTVFEYLGKDSFFSRVYNVTTSQLCVWIEKFYYDVPSYLKTQLQFEHKVKNNLSGNSFHFYEYWEHLPKSSLLSQ